MYHMHVSGICNAIVTRTRFRMYVYILTLITPTTIAAAATLIKNADKEISCMIRSPYSRNSTIQVKSPHDYDRVFGGVD